MIDQYSLDPFLAELPASAIAVGERGMVRPQLRGSDVMMKLMAADNQFVNENRIQLVFGNCEPHLLNLYLGMGMRTYAATNINSAEAGYLIPIVSVVEDYEYLKKLNSPLLPFMRDFGDDARIPAIMQRDLADGSAVMSRLQTTSTSYCQISSGTRLRFLPSPALM